MSALPPPACAVYPRVCGGTYRSYGIGGTYGGLSPRVRGNLGRNRRPPRVVGSIPACAGEPYADANTLHRWEVYPRVCGGTQGGGQPGGRYEGLSPRVRGNQIRAISPEMPDWSIPACAGEPAPAAGRNRASQVYPRVCGGTGGIPSGGSPGGGLSPRVRGNRRRFPSIVGQPGSIPACAGEPTGRGIAPPVRRVYPRVCGGTLVADAPVRRNEGLSPRVRGNLFIPPSALSGRRSIPACAGEPPPVPPVKRVVRVYPRVCGGTVPEGVRGEDGIGLSPRVRGNPL